ncbi:MAG TPA: cytochrome c biogenesis protein/redoxin [Pyrinomonadaceae bacterium]|nr:cytochrome c biogenesis protein/redoxin [Pyrinomonadaceae bacterium]
MEGSNITIALAFVAGLASFLSPCVLPLVPGYISLISGVSIDHLKGEVASRTSARRAVIVNSLAFNAGVSIIFVLLGATAGWIGNVLFSSPWVRVVGGLVIILFGLQLMGVLKIGALYRDTRKFSDDKPRGMFGSLLLGMAFAAGWTPCIGPILGGIIGLAATSGGWKSGLVLSLFYSAGLAVPFLLTGVLLNQFLGFYTWFRRHLHKVEVFSGVMLIVMGLMVASNSLTWVATVAAKMGINAEGWVQKWGTKEKEGSTGATATDGRAPQPATAANAAFEPAPDVELKTLDGQPFRLKDLRGRVVLLNFWATWCVPCRSEIPTLSAMNRELEGRGFTVVGVTTHDTADLVNEYQKDTKQDYKVLLGGSDAASAYAVGVLPTTFIIDREGRVRQKIIGEKTRDGFEAIVKPLLDEAPAATASNGGN